MTESHKESNRQVLNKNKSTSEKVRSKKQIRTKQEIQNWLISKLTEYLGIETEDIDTRVPFASYGMSSREAVILSGDLENWLGRQFSPTLLYEYPDIEAMSQYLANDTNERKVDTRTGRNQKIGVEPIAIIGMSCRFPGASSLEDFWELLQNGVDAITEVPEDRWDIDAYYDQDPTKPGKMNTRWGGFLDQIDQFDPQLFGISPREARRMDPQQRLLLEVAWEAIEDAGQSLKQLVNTRTGIFIGISSNDYGHLQFNDPCLSDPYMGTGNALSIAANRLSYIFGFRGPSIAVDTACSSSIVAIHLACSSLLNGESTLALAGGVNLILSPTITVNFTKAGFMAPDGRCKAFDARADGYVRGEGAGIVVLKPLSQAIAQCDRIYAVIRGSAVNQDGRTNGLTAPSQKAQEAVLHDAYQKAGISPHKIQYIEAHGTGTALGDPIEVKALGNVLGADRQPERLCRLGSVKTNIGHLEAAAGIASLIKVALSLKHKVIPPSLHFNTPNPYIPFNNLPFCVQTTLEQWPGLPEPALAGISSFGFGGTNAHIILEEAPRLYSDHQNDKTESDFERSTHILTLSAKNEKALEELVDRYRLYLDSHSETPLADICFTANTGRSHFDHRMAIIAESPVQLHNQLNALKAQTKPAGLTTGIAKTNKHSKIVFLFTGWGCQYIGMGRQLYETQPAFHQTLDHIDEILRPYFKIPLLKVMYPASGESSPINEIAYYQPALFALEYALSEVWKTWGIKPTVVLGHGLGEYTAACVAGILSLEDSLKLITARARFMQCMTQESKLSEFEQVAAAIKYSSPQIDIISDLTGELNSDEITTAEYWCRHIFQPVQFPAGMETLHRLGYEVFLEIGPEPNLIEKGRCCLQAKAGVWLPSLRKGCSDWQQMLESLGALYIRGFPVDWTGFDRDYRRHRVKLPTYPFQQQRYWVEKSKLMLQKSKKLPGIHTKSMKDSPLLGKRLFSAALGKNEIQFESIIGPDLPAFLKHHRVFQKIILPATGYFEMALAACTTLYQSSNFIIEEFIIWQALILEENETKTVQFLLVPDKNSSQGIEKYSFQIFSLVINEENGEPSWILHVSGIMLNREKRSALPNTDLTGLQSRCTEKIPVEIFYQKFQEQGIDYGYSFQAIEQLQKGQGEALGLIRLPNTLIPEVKDYKFHPVLLDAAMQVVGAVLMSDADNQNSYLPVSIKRIRVFRHPDIQVWSYARISPAKYSNQETLLAEEVRLFACDGQVIAIMEGLLLKKTSRKALLRNTQQSWQNWFYEVEWVARKTQQPPPDYLPLPEAIRDRLSLELPQLISSSNLESYQEALISLETLSIDYVLTAFQEMGWEFQLSNCFSTAEIAEQLGVAGQHQRLLERLLKMLEEENILHRENRLWKVGSIPELRNPQMQMEILLTQYPAAEAELVLLERCGSKLAHVLKGEYDPLQLLFPEGNLTTVGRLYRDSPGSRVMNTLIQRAVVSMVEHLPQGRTVRILEIGAGTGGTTSYILPHLPVDQTEYVFTDVSPIFTTQARQKFREYKFVSYQLLNIESNPATQGFSSHHYDIIIAANVLHATKNLRQTLGYIQYLLSPGGMFVLLEGIIPLRWLDLIFGITAGWWRFVDHDLRPSHPLIDAKCWQQLMQESGFKQSAIISSDHESGNAIFQQAIIVTQASTQPGLKKSGPTPRNWLILADAQGVGRQLATLLKERNELCTLAFPGKSYEQISDQEFRVNPENLSDFQQLINQKAGGDNPPLYGVIHLWSLDAFDTQPIRIENIEASLKRICGSTLLLVQALIKEEFSKTASLWLVTRNAQPVGVNPVPLEVTQSPLWGMGRVISLEHPDLWGGMIDLAPEASDHDAAILLSEIWEPQDEDHLAFRNGRCYAARLRHKNQPASKGVQFHPDSAYLITGGLGFLGLRVVRWMIEHGARYFILTGRSEIPGRDCWPGLPENTDMAKRIRTIMELEEMGATIIIQQADVSNPDQMTHLFKQMSTSQFSLKGIIHAAGVPGYQYIKDIKQDTLSSVFRPKAVGAWLLHQLSRDINLDFFICFSSASAVWGARGQGHYAAANHFLDALAHYRHSLGLPALSINWGLFPKNSIVGEEYHAWLEKIGLKEMQTDQGFDAMGCLLAEGTVQTTLAKIDWNVFKKIYEARGQRALMNEIITQPLKATFNKKSKQQSGILQQLKAVPESDRESLLKVYMQDQIAKVLEVGVSQIDMSEQLNNLGFDSLMAVELRNRINTDLGMDMPMVGFMEAFSIDSLVTEMNKQLKEIFSTLYESSHTATPEDSKIQTDKIDVSAGIRPEQAEYLLTNMDELSDTEIEVLLNSIVTGDSSG